MKILDVLFELPTTSDEISSNVLMSSGNGKCELKFRFYEDENTEKEFFIEVEDVYKSIFTSDSCCNVFQLENSYEQLITIANSAIMESVINDARQLGIVINGKIRHYMLYIPDYGCYEFIAAGVSHLTKEIGSESKKN